MKNKSWGIKGIAKSMITILALSLWIPTALAANSVISNVNVSLDPFYIMVPNANPTPSVTVTYNLLKGGYASADVTEQIKDSNGDVVYFWGSNLGNDTNNDPDGVVTRTWDGKANTGDYDGEFVPSGNYTFYVKSHVTSPPDTEATKSFKVERTVVPSINLLSSAPPVYYTGSGSYTLNYVLAVGSGNAPIVRLTVNGPKNNSPQDVVIADNTKTQDGNYTISWDGKINNNTAPAGDYSYKLNVTNSANGYTTNSTDITGTFKVSNNQQPSPNFSDVNAEPSSFNPADESVDFSYMLNNSLGLTSVTAAVYQSSDLNAAVKTWQFTSQASGKNTITWDGKDKSNNVVGNGNYIFKVTGADGNFSLVPQQVSFTVSKSSTPAPQDQTCAGFSDVKQSDQDCAAIEYVKGLGSITGNPDGTFAPDDLLQRDQVAKIILETFDLFNKQIDYCSGVSAFPDTTEDEWSFQYICRGKKLGMINGYSTGPDAGLYKPSRSVNRAEFLALLLRNLDENMPTVGSASYTDVDADAWFSGYAKYSKDNSLFTGSKLEPTNFVSRREVAEVIYKLHQKGKL